MEKIRYHAKEALKKTEVRMESIPDSIRHREARFTDQDLYDLHIFLLDEAESLLGERDKNFFILPPSFSEDAGPNIRFSEDRKLVFTELHKCAQSYWPSAVYQMAHETVHLLDPRPGASTWLEEAVAVEFALFIQKKLGHSAYMPTEKYYDAWRILHLVGRDTFAVARRIRKICGTLHTEDLAALRREFTKIHRLDKTILPQLVSEF